MKITIDNITEQQLEDMIEIISKIKYKEFDTYRFNPIDLTFRAQQLFIKMKSGR